MMLRKKAEDILEEHASEETNVNTTKSILHITADNIDILSEALDGKGTFHATQMVACMRGRFGTSAVLSSLKASKAQTLQVPQSLNKIYPSKVILGKKEPVFKGEAKKEWFALRELEAKSVQKAHAADLAFVFRGQESTKRVGWTLFNKNLTTRDPEMSAISYMPLILNPALELETLVTVLERSISVADRLGEKYVVLTAD